MKIEKIDKEPNRKYPYLGILYQNDKNLETIVLFNEKNTGIVILSKNSMFKTGYFSKSWTENYFKHYFGEVIISND